MARGIRSACHLMRAVAIVAITAAAAILPATGAEAHEVREVGGLTFVVGWSSEPAYAGFGNEVQVIVTRGDRPVEGGTLEAEVIFGEPDAETRTDPIPLEPAFDTPNEYLGYLIPTRPGTYSFHVTGSVAGQQIDESFTSGEDTFDEVRNPTDAEFPVQDPTRGEISEKLDRITARLDALRSEVSVGDPTALWIAIG
jgi:hypothetical protein